MIVGTSRAAVRLAEHAEVHKLLDAMHKDVHGHIGCFSDMPVVQARTLDC